MNRDETLVVQGCIVEVRGLGAQASVALEVHAIWRVSAHTPGGRDLPADQREWVAIWTDRGTARQLAVGQRIVALVEQRRGRWCLGAVDVEGRSAQSAPRVAARATTGY